MYFHSGPEDWPILENILKLLYSIHYIARLHIFTSRCSAEPIAVRNHELGGTQSLKNVTNPIQMGYAKVVSN